MVLYGIFSEPYRAVYPLCITYLNHKSEFDFLNKIYEMTRQYFKTCSCVGVQNWGTHFNETCDYLNLNLTAQYWNLIQSPEFEI